MSEESPRPEPRNWRRFVKPGLRWAEHLLAAAGFFFLVYFACFDLSYMVTPSMAPTLEGGKGRQADWILTERISGWFCDPDRWEVITFQDRYGVQLMKRVVALPNETISMPDVDQLLIDGKLMERPEHLGFIQYLPTGNIAQGKSVTVPEDSWYVLGDQVRDSLDSRYEGPVPEERVVGQAWFRVWPLSRFGFVR